MNWYKTFKYAAYEQWIKQYAPNDPPEQIQRALIELNRIKSLNRFPEIHDISQFHSLQELQQALLPYQYVRSNNSLGKNRPTKQEQQNPLNNGNFSPPPAGFHPDFVQVTIIDNQVIASYQNIQVGRFGVSPVSIFDSKNWKTEKSKDLIGLYGFWVNPYYRNFGIGMKMLTKFIEHAKQQGFKQITLDSTPGAVSLYERAGFRHIDGPKSRMILNLQ